MTPSPPPPDWPDSFGDAPGEYGAARRRSGYAGGTRALLWAEGPDAVDFLQGVLSQDVAAMSPGETARSFLLEPRGKLQDLLWVLRGEGRAGLVTTPARLDSTRSALERWKLRVDAELRADPRTVWETWGPDAYAPPGGGWAENGEGGLTAELADSPMRRCLAVGFTEGFWEAAGARPMGRLAYDTLRAEAGEPLMGVDVDEKTIPQETGLAAEAVSFTKGCYLGQELVARIDSRGRVNRRLCAVSMPPGVVPPAGALAERGGRTVGRLTTVGRANPAGAVALSMIHREAEAGETVEVVWEEGRIPGAVERLPLSPRLPKL